MGSSHTDFAALDAAVEEALRNGDYGRILGLIAVNLSDSDGAPHLLRYVGLALEALERFEDAADLYADVAEYSTETNQPLDAILALKALALLGEDERVDALVQRLAELYSVGSSRLRSGTTPVGAPIDGAVLVEPIGEDVPIDVLAENAMLACQSVTQAGVQALATSPIPLMSDLDGDDFTSLVEALEPRTYGDKEPLVTRDERLPGVWWLVFGGFSVHHEELGSRAFTGPNLVVGLEALFGENAQVAINSLGRSDTLFLPKEKLAALMNDRPGLREKVRQAVSRYEVHQAISRCELFRRLPVAEHAHLLAGFAAHRVPAEQVLVGQNARSPGVFLITHGGVDFRVERDGALRTIQELGPGALFGLDVLADGERSPVSAVTRVNTRLLFLEAEALERALDQHPKAKEILQDLRLADAALTAHSADAG